MDQQTPNYKFLWAVLGILSLVVLFQVVVVSPRRKAIANARSSADVVDDALGMSQLAGLAASDEASNSGGVAPTTLLSETVAAKPATTESTETDTTSPETRGATVAETAIEAIDSEPMQAPELTSVETSNPTPEPSDPPISVDTLTDEASTLQASMDVPVADEDVIKNDDTPMLGTTEESVAASSEELTDEPATPLLASDTNTESAPVSPDEASTPQASKDIPVADEDVSGSDDSPMLDTTEESVAVISEPPSTETETPSVAAAASDVSAPPSTDEAPEHVIVSEEPPVADSEVSHTMDDQASNADATAKDDKTADDGPSADVAKPAKEIVKAPKAATKSGRPWVGLKLRNDAPVIIQIKDGSPAASAGFKLEDRIVQMQGKSSGGTAQIIKLLSGKSPGDEITFTLDRDGETKQVKLTLGDAADAVPVKAGS